jgi:hypothetical protein
VVFKVRSRHLFFRRSFPILFFVFVKAYVSCIRGRQGANGLFDGKSKLPQPKWPERVHKITRTTPSACPFNFIPLI